LFNYIKGFRGKLRHYPSEGEPGFFELSPNEVQVALQALKSKKRKKYMVIVVHCALSQQPKMRPVGNPYEKSRKKYLRIEPGGAQIYFKILFGII
jgi:hypothetical protein